MAKKDPMAATIIMTNAIAEVSPGFKAVLGGESEGI